jgi:hypothetical protein
MATDTLGGSGVFTYPQWALRMDPTGKTSYLVNLLSQNNPMLNEMMAVPCQNGNSFEFTQVVQLPTPVRRAYNQGVAATTASVAKQVQTAVEYDDTMTIDSSLAELNGQRNELRAREAMLHMQAMGQKVASDLFYSNNTTDPTAFTGLFNIYNTVSTATSQIANNVIDCGGTGSTNSSIALIGWGDNQIHTIFPNGFPAGLQHLDKGLERVYDQNGLPFYAWCDWFQWNIGLAIHDWRYAVRACNIDVTLFGGASAPDLIGILAAMVMKPPVMQAGVAPVQTADDPTVVQSRFAFYCNRTVYLALDNQARTGTNILLQMEQWAGVPTLTYRGVPIRVSDALTTTETRVV